MINNDIVKGQLKQWRGEVQRQWGKLSNDALDVINGDRAKLMGSIQEAYGIKREEAHKQIIDWEEKVSRSAENDDDCGCGHKH